MGIRLDRVARATLFALVTLTACSTAKTRIFPKEGGNYMMVASGPSESDAFDESLKRSQEHCEKMGKHFVMVDQKSEYQGADKTAKTVAGVATALFASGGPTHTTGRGDTNDDYKITMNFKCQ